MITRPGFALNHTGGTLVGLVLSESHEMISDVTEFPVDSGAAVTDNIRPESRKLTLEILFSETPLTWGIDGSVTLALDVAQSMDPGNMAGGIESLVASAGSLLSSAILPGPSITIPSWGGVDLVQEAFNTLEAIHASGELIQVVTGLRTYDNLALKSATPGRQNTSLALRVQCTFIQITKASTSFVELPSVLKKAAGKLKSKGAAKVSAPSPVDKRTMLAKLADRTGIGF